MVRSPHAHARIVRIDTAPALATPGVLVVLTGADLVADGLKALSHRPVPTNPHEVPLKSPDGSPFFVSDPLPLPVDRARFVGEPVAMVVAETALAARDGAERVTVEWEPLPAVVTSTDAIAAGAVAVWDACASNVAVETEAGDATATDAAFARAAHVVTLDSRINRVTGVPMEPRAAVGDFDASTGRYTVYAGSGGSWRIRNDVAVVLGVPPESVRVIAREVGGSYGTRNPCYPEYPLVGWAARRVRRPVKWTGDRRESLISDCHARDLVVHAELALDADGTFLAYRAVNTSNVGAHTVSFIPLAKGIGISTSVYHVPAASLRGRAVLSNTAPTSPYRAAGRPEIMYVIERLIDLAARRHGFDRIALRRKNLVPSSAMPYRNPVGLVYDSGDYAAALDRLVELSDWKGFESRRADARRRGRYRGIGFAHYIELNTGDPRERAEITVRPEGRIDVVLGTLSAGQGHETSFPQLIAEWFGVELGNVKLITGDTDLMPVGGGTASGRSMRLGAVVMAKASDQIVEKGRRIAASLLEAAEPDIEFARRRFTVKGTDRSVDLFEAAAAAVRVGRTARRRVHRGHAGAVVSVRLRGVRSGSGSRHRRRRGRATYDGGRRRTRSESDDLARPGARRHRRRHRPGAVGALRVRRVDRSAHRRDVDGLRATARGRAAIVRDRAQRSALDVESARVARRRRRRHDAGARRGRQRGRRRARRIRRRTPRHARHAGARLARDPRRQRL